MQGGSYDLDVSIPASGTDSFGRPAVAARDLLVVHPRSGKARPPGLIAEGASAQLPGGSSLRFAQRGYFVVVSVADDAAVPAIYALFVIAAVGLAIAVLFPPKRVWSWSQRMRAHTESKPWHGTCGAIQLPVLRSRLAGNQYQSPGSGAV